MSARGAGVFPQKFCCPICLELLKDPVTPACGHSYCRSCLQQHWDSEEELRGVCSCPQCRETFSPRPDLRRNIMIAELVEELKKTGLQAPADHCFAFGPGDVACDFCTGRKRKALKSCLVCLVSYCESHLRPHLDVAALKKHQLVEPSQKLQENICPRHDEALKMFCRTDRLCICYLCSVDQHQGHDVVSAAAERSQRQEELEETRLKVRQELQDTEGDLKLLQEEAKVLRGSADGAVEQSDRIFTELIRELQRRSSEVKRQIRSRQEAEERRVQELQEKLEQQMVELKRRDADLQQLELTQDHTWFLQHHSSLPTLGPSRTRTRTCPLRLFEDLTAAVSQVGGLIQDILTQTRTNVLLPRPEPEPRRRADLLKFSREIRLDPNSANSHLWLSDGNRKVTLMEEKRSCSDHPDQFKDYYQVLGRDSLTGRCYWEVQRSGGGVGVAVSYRSISRTGSSSLQSVFGLNDRSWMLVCDGDRYVFRQNQVETPVSGPVSSRVGVFLDHGAGVVSFYSVSDTVTLLHRVQATFTQPLCAGVGLYSLGSSAEFCPLR